MGIQVNQEFCAGCGMCLEACSVGAIQLINHQAVIDDVLCKECEACIEACPNGAITAIYEPAQRVPIAARPVAETQIIPAPNPTVLPETAAPVRGLAPLAGAALAFLGHEVAPRLVDVLVNAFERRLTQPTATVITPSNPSASVLTTQSRGKQRQARYHGGRSGMRNQKGRR